MHAWDISASALISNANLELSEMYVVAFCVLRFVSDVGFGLTCVSLSACAVHSCVILANSAEYVNPYAELSALSVCDL